VVIERRCCPTARCSGRRLRAAAERVIVGETSMSGSLVEDWICYHSGDRKSSDPLFDAWEGH
jgi:hypothetical protein